MKFKTEDLLSLYMSIIDNIGLEVDESLKDILKTKLRAYGTSLDKRELEEFQKCLVGNFELLSYITTQLLELNRNRKGLVTLTEKEIGLYTNLAKRYTENTALFDRRMN